jgi:hypothetical protein
MLTKRFANGHRVSLRYDTFDMHREETGLNIDRGHAWTIGYRFETTRAIGWAFEWLSIESTRELWPNFYDSPATARERQLRLQMNFRLGSAH